MTNNKEIIKAINKKEKKHNFRRWWNSNGYKIMRIIFFPVWIIAKILKKIDDSLNSRNKWSEERAKEIFDYYIPRKANWDNENKIIIRTPKSCEIVGLYWRDYYKVERYD